MKENKFLTAIAMIGSATKWMAIAAVLGAIFWLIVIVGRKILDELISCFQAWPRGCTITAMVIVSPLIIFGLIKFWRWSYDYLSDREHIKRMQKKAMQGGYNPPPPENEPMPTPPPAAPEINQGQKLMEF